jgi:tetratricopeptide (TPR) repeat protein
MYELKALSHAAIPAALAQAERYRLLNEPAEAESICRDILRIEPDHQDALVTMVLALTDQFPDGAHARVAAEADKTVARVRDEYKRLYIMGIVRERRGKAVLRSHHPGSGRSAQEWLKEAMACYERAEAIRPSDNDEAVLRWNTCARILMGMPAPEPDLHEFSAIQSE